MSALRNPRVQASLIVLLATGAGAGLWWTKRYVPNQVTLETIRAHERELTDNNRRAQKALAELGVEEMTGVIRQLDAQAARVQQFVPADSAGVSATLDQMVINAERATGVKITFSQPLDDAVSHGFRAKRYEFRVHGGYHDVGAFLSSMLTLGRISQLQQVMLAPLPGVATGMSDAPAGEHTLGSMATPVEATFIFMAFVMDPAPPTTAAAAPSPTPSSSPTAAPGAAPGAAPVAPSAAPAGTSPTAPAPARHGKPAWVDGPGA